MRAIDVEYYDRPDDQPTDQQTDMRVHREVAQLQ